MVSDCCWCVAPLRYSANGLDWDISPVIAYTPTQAFEDGRRVTFRARERPHVILDNNGELTHLINGVCNYGSVRAAIL